MNDRSPIEGFADPNTKLTGTVTAHVTSMTPDKSRITGEPQIKFNLTTKFGNNVDVWLTITNKKMCQMFLDAGILERTGEGMLRPVILDKQPWLKVKFQDNKVIGFIPIEYEAV